MIIDIPTTIAVEKIIDEQFAACISA